MMTGALEVASARLEVRVVSGQSAVTSARASNPLKLLVPRARGPSVWAYLSSFGGGFVAGDETSLDVTLGPAARCFLTTQALTKIYRNPRRRPCSHRLQATLAENSLLVLAPEPIQAFADSSYTQRQEFRLHPGASLVMVDWFCSGRVACGERWSFTQLRSRNEVFLGDDRLLFDSLLLDAAQGAHRMGRFNCLALIVVLGPSLRAAVTQLLAGIGAAPVLRRANLVLSASPLGEGALLRIAGERMEDVAREIQTRLAFVAEFLRDDPWARKW